MTDSNENEGGRCPDSAATEDGVPRKKVVIVAEDDLDIRFVECKIMEIIMERILGAEHNLEISAHADGTSAIEKIDQVIGDIRSELVFVFSDHMMPGKTGLAVYNHLRTKSATIPFLLVSGGMGSDDDVRAAGEFGARDPYFCFLQKPFEFDQAKAAAQKIYFCK